MDLIKGNNVMIDLETYDVSPTSVIRSIGAVKFNEKNIFSCFYANVSMDSCKKLGMTVSSETVKWWESQSEQSKEMLEIDKKDIETALKLFNKWYGDRSIPTWGNGCNFDNVIMENAYKVTGITCPWKYWHCRCFRTVKDLFPEFHYIHAGTKHYSLDDAKSQAIYLIELKSYIGR